MPVFGALGALARRSSNLPAAPPGERVWAIGDVHGRRDLLDELLDLIAAEEERRAPADVQLIFLGDLVDRGPDSSGVLDRVAALKRGPLRVRVLKGNHDDLFLRSVKGDARALRHLIRIGGRETVLSYGIPPSEYAALDYAQLAERLRHLVPPEQVELLESMELMAVVGDYLFVHAGIRPNVPIEEQSEEDCYWIRSEFLNWKRPFEKFVIHGHSISSAEEVRSNRIGIDTGAFESGRLTAIGLEGQERVFLST